MIGRRMLLTGLSASLAGLTGWVGAPSAAWARQANPATRPPAPVVPPDEGNLNFPPNWGPTSREARLSEVVDGLRAMAIELRAGRRRLLDQFLSDGDTLQSKVQALIAGIHQTDQAHDL